MVFCSKWCSAQSGVLLNLGGVLLKVVFCSESGVLVNIHGVFTRLSELYPKVSSNDLPLSYHPLS